MSYYTQIKEPVNVLADFSHNQVKPLVFKWGNQDYQVEKINLVHMSHEGREKIYYFSVSDAANYFKLKFNTGSLEWNLEEMYSN